LSDIAQSRRISLDATETIRVLKERTLNDLTSEPVSPSVAELAAAQAASAQAVEASAKDHRRAIVFFFAILISLGIAWKLAKELEILYVSALFAVVLMPIVNSICKLNIRGWQPSRAIGIVLMLLTVGLALSLFFLIALPPVMRDLSQFLTDLPQRIPVAVAKLKHLPMADKLGLDTIAQKAQGAIEATASYLFTSLPMWLAHIFDIVTAAFLCLYFMLEGEHAYEFFLSLVRTSSRGRLDQTLRKAETKMSKWLLGQGLLMLTLGVTSTIVFLIFHIRYAVLLGVLMGLFNIIPVAGGILTMGLVCIVAALDSWTKLFEVVAFYLIYLNLENALLTPRIMKSSVDLMGLTVLVALLVGTALAGIVGALVAVPTAALVVVLLDEYAVKRT
jgi:predicted PurR-regulated permease PerM